MDSLNRALIQSINNCLLKAQWYSQQNDDYYLDECGDWLDVAKGYIIEMKAQSGAKNSNSCSNKV